MPSDQPEEERKHALFAYTSLVHMDPKVIADFLHPAEEDDLLQFLAEFADGVYFDSWNERRKASAGVLDIFYESPMPAVPMMLADMIPWIEERRAWVQKKAREWQASQKNHRPKTKKHYDLKNAFIEKTGLPDILQQRYLGSGPIKFKIP